MPLFRITKKLATVLKVTVSPSPVENENAEHTWFADLFYVEGKKCVIWTHRSTLFMFVKPAVVAAELRAFHPLFRYEFRTASASMTLPESLLDRFDVYGDECYVPTNARPVVGSMLDYRNMFEVMVSVAGGLERADIRGISAQLNDSPMSVLGMDSALEAVRKLVGQESA
jgi:hypothetical protein